MKKLIMLLFLVFLLSQSAHALQKNTASQKWVVFAFNDTDNSAKTGDAANITANLRIDGGAANAVDDTNPTELEDGYYIFDITAAESNGECIVICPASSTANIQVIGCPMACWTTPANFPDFDISATDGRVDVKEVAGTAQTANDNGADINAILVDTSTTLDDFLDTEIASLVAFWNVFILTSGTIGAVGNDTTHLHLTGQPYGNDELNDYIVVTYDNSEAEYHSSWITDWVLATELATVATLPFTPENSVDPYWVFSMRKHPDVTTTLNNLATAQADLDTITGTAGVLIATDAQDLSGSLDVNTKTITAGAITGAAIATDAVDADALKTDFVTEIWAQAMSDLAAGAPSATASVLTAINYLYEAWRNQTWATSSEIAIYKDDGATKLVESDISDDGTTFKRGEMGVVD
jgi:hypothetical protein